jgi:hypothetical protein
VETQAKARDYISDDAEKPSVVFNAPNEYVITTNGPPPMAHPIHPLRSLRVFELRIELSSAFSRQIEDIPDRYQLVDAAFF